MKNNARIGAAYLTTFHERLAAFRNYLMALSGETSDAHSAINKAIEFFIEFTIRLADQAEELVVDETDIFSVLSPLMTHLRKVERIADQLFSRGHALAVPRALRAATVRELQDLGLHNRIPVIVIGPPQNFETYISDLREFMFSMLDLVDTKPSDLLTMISLPYLEGTRALWAPVTMGHELGHLVESSAGIVDTLDTRRWISREMMTPSRVDLERLPVGVTNSLDIVEEARVILRNWVVEILCDVHAVRRFGPAAFASLSEFLISIGDLNKTYQSHPASSFRIYCMARFLGPDLGAYRDAVEPWSEFGDREPSGTAGRPTSFDAVLVNTILDHFPQICDAAGSMSQRTYDWKRREALVVELCRNFVDYVPAVSVGSEIEGLVSQEDVLNAGWLARAQHEADQSSKTRSEALVMLDRIVGKSLDDLDFVNLWEQAGDEKSVDSTAVVSSRQENQSVEGLGDNPRMVLSANEISKRLRSNLTGMSTDRSSLIVTPCISSAPQGATLDVRLSTRFIVFKRSATPVFDALDQFQDPREMQELVEKDWAGTFILHPLELVLAATLEYIVMPCDLTAQLITRSSHGRLGLLSATAVQVHPNFRGCLTLELVNLGQVPLALTPGERIAQLVFSPISPQEAFGKSKYEYPTGPQFSRVKADSDNSRLRAMRELRKPMHR
jgi:deoxycytidine triphosphate deaminase